MAARADRPVTVAVDGLTKQFGAVTAVDGLSFSVRPGRVTGFLGPNGAGKTTTLRMLVGLVRPDAGSATVDGVPYSALPDPSRVVGAAIEAGGFHPGRTARRHLAVVALQAGLPADRADALIRQVGLSDAAERRVGGFSHGMRQRLALATALLGDPQVLLLDEPANGLDPEGIAWLRDFLRWYAAQGRTVLVSSHQLAEVAQSADDVVIIDRGRLVRCAPLTELLVGAGPRVRVRAQQTDQLAVALAAVGLVCERTGPDELVVDGTEPAIVGAAASRAGVTLHLLVPEHPDLEQVFLELVGGSGRPGGAR